MGTESEANFETQNNSSEILVYNLSLEALAIRRLRKTGLKLHPINK